MPAPSSRCTAWPAPRRRRLLGDAAAWRATRPRRRGTAIRLPDAAGHAARAVAAPRRQRRRRRRGAPRSTLATWRWLEVRSGVVTIEAATVDRFVPQMVNYELVGGVDFQKGCYPGQEVVARSQYRGTTKRRTFLFESDAVAGAGPGRLRRRRRAASPPARSPTPRRARRLGRQRADRAAPRRARRRRAAPGQRRRPGAAPRRAALPACRSTPRRGLSSRLAPAMRELFVYYRVATPSARRGARRGRGDAARAARRLARAARAPAHSRRRRQRADLDGDLLALAPGTRRRHRCRASKPRSSRGARVARAA